MRKCPAYVSICSSSLPGFLSQQPARVFQILVMSGVSTSPLMINNQFDQILCLFRGHKRLALVNANRYPDVRQVEENERHHLTAMHSFRRVDRLAREPRVSRATGESREVRRPMSPVSDSSLSRR